MCFNQGLDQSSRWAASLTVNFRSGPAYTNGLGVAGCWIHGGRALGRGMPAMHAWGWGGCGWSWLQVARSGKRRQRVDRCRVRRCDWALWVQRFRATRQRESYPTHPPQRVWPTATAASRCTLVCPQHRHPPPNVAHNISWPRQGRAAHKAAFSSEPCALTCCPKSAWS